MTDRKTFFTIQFKNNLKAYDQIWKIATGQGDDYTTVCLLYCNYFKKLNKMIVTDVNKQHKLDTNLKAIQQINFTENLGRNGNTTRFFLIEEGK